MKLNYEALRSVMLNFQIAPMNPDEAAVISESIQQGFTQEDVEYAVKQAIDDELLTGTAEMDLSGSMEFTVSDITPKGHRFIDSITQDTHWNRVKDYLKDEGLPITIPTITKAIAKIFL